MLNNEQTILNKCVKKKLIWRFLEKNYESLKKYHKFCKNVEIISNHSKFQIRYFEII